MLLLVEMINQSIWNCTQIFYTIAGSESKNEIAKDKVIKSKSEKVVSESKNEKVKNKVIKSKTKKVDS